MLLALPLLFAGCNNTDTPDVGEQDTGDASSVRYDYDLSEYVKLGTYKGVEIDAYGKTVTDEDVQKQVLIARSTYATVAEKEGAAAKGDQVVIDFVGYMDGEKFEGGSAENYNVMIGSGSMIDGFESGLIGVMPGETVTLDLTFPTPYMNNTALSGKPVQFEVTVKTVFEQVLPVYDDAFVMENYKCATVEEFEKTIYDALVEQNETERKNYIVQAVWEKIAETSEIIEYPAPEYTAIYQDNLNYYEGIAAEAGVTLNEYVLNQYGMDVSTFHTTLQNNIYTMMQEQMILLAIAQKENITLSDAEYEAGVQKYTEYYGLSSTEEFTQHFTKEEITESLIFDKVYEFLAANAIEK